MRMTKAMALLFMSLSFALAGCKDTSASKKKISCGAGAMCFLKIDVFKPAPKDCLENTVLIDGAEGQRFLARHCQLPFEFFHTEFDAFYVQDPRTPTQNGRLATLSAGLPGSAFSSDAELVSLKDSLIKMYGPRSDSGGGAFGITSLFCRDTEYCDEGYVILSEPIPLSSLPMAPSNTFGMTFRKIKWLDLDVIKGASRAVKIAERG